MKSLHQGGRAIHINGGRHAKNVLALVLGLIATCAYSPEYAESCATKVLEDNEKMKTLGDQVIEI